MGIDSFFVFVSGKVNDNNFVKKRYRDFTKLSHWAKDVKNRP